MEDIDTTGNATYGPTGEEEDIFFSEVIRGEYELLYLDTYLRETLGQH